MNSRKNPFKPGRPAKGEGPRIPYDEVDRLLVFGEVVEAAEGGSTVVYPSYRDLGQRYGVAHSLVAKFARKHDCQRRRKDAKVRLDAKVEQRVLEMRATALALSKDDALRMIDTYLMGFEKALAEQRVRYDNPSDFNTMLRLKEFIQGNADSRQEVYASLSLEDLQARHQRMLRMQQAASAGERGEVLDVLPAARSERADRMLARNPPAPPSATAAGKCPDTFAASVAPTVPKSTPDTTDAFESEGDPGGTRGRR